MPAKGMDVQAVRSTAAALRAAADEFEAVGQELAQSLDEVDWSGPDAVRFRSRWTTEIGPQIQRMRDAAHELSLTALRDAAEQEAVSTS